MKKFLLSLSLLLTGNFVQSQTTLLDEGFESYTDFSISGFGNWLTLDLDQLPTYTGGGGSWDNANDPQAFMIFNPTTAGVTNQATPTIDDDEVRNFDPHGGQKYAAAWNSVPSGGVGNNDWLVSPPVTLGTSNNTLTLWVKSLSNSYGLEKYKIGIYIGSGTPTSSANFTIISGASSLLAPYPNWEQKSYNLDTYAGQTIRVGINCLSNDNYMFMVDDVKITATTLSTNETSKVKSPVSIYPNPTKSEINIKTDKKIKSYTLIDANGKLALKAESTSADLSILPTGIYIMDIEFTDGSKVSEKVIKQ
ncbi:T9SS-dependent choice-of-anchor J family protein [Chryseobacterium oryctis]|uniref:T9SS type A sorting domain-containing protein n=1 Tax=Chryseobacterium oryctis TaxID=2952618 RepID=A0ABT3HLA3_9FLAO|nr:T9SS type A sorting domain-containing protein [Chryseobacterium oryctis]MCW3160562.1 T9SS type A sorting domain-containing protein [Chryseobacterium oryctis]